jgi:hypothetical protein
MRKNIPRRIGDDISGKFIPSTACRLRKLSNPCSLHPLNLGGGFTPQSLRFVGLKYVSLHIMGFAYYDSFSKKQIASKGLIEISKFAIAHC